MHWNFLRLKKEVVLLYRIRFRRLVSYPINDKRKRVSTFIIDETVIQIGSQHFWLWMCIEPIHSSVLGIHILKERNMFVPENFIDP